MKTQLVRSPFYFFRLFRGFFGRRHNVGREHVGNDSGHSKPSRHSNLPCVVDVHRVLAKAHVDNAVNNTQFGDAVGENRFGFGADNVPLLVDNGHGSLLGHKNSPELLESVFSIGRTQEAAKNKWWPQ